MNRIETIRRELKATIMLPGIGACEYCGSTPARTVKGREHLGPMCRSCTRSYFEAFSPTGWREVVSTDDDGAAS